jgi:hypothetical protein
MNIEFWELAMQRLIAFRDAGNDRRCFDIHFAPFQSDPISVIADLYRFLGETFTPDTQTRMQAWRRSTPREAHDDYDSADFGLNLDALRKRFAFYSTRFNVADSTSADLAKP